MYEDENKNEGMNNVRERRCNIQSPAADTCRASFPGLKVQLRPYVALQVISLSRHWECYLYI